MTDRATCEPPPEHRHHEWHWLRPTWTDEPTRMRWWPTMQAYALLGHYRSPEALYNDGWRYVGPAEPPQEG